MFLSLLQMRELQVSQLAPTQPAAKQYRKNRTIPFSLERHRIRCLPQATGFFSREPITKADSQLLHAFHAADAGGELWTEQSGVCGFIGEPSHCSEPTIDRSSRQPAVLKGNSETGYNDLVE